MKLELLEKLKHLQVIVQALIDGKEVQVMDNGKWAKLDPSSAINSSWTMRVKPEYRWYTREEAIAMIDVVDCVYDNTDHTVGTVMELCLGRNGHLLRLAGSDQEIYWDNFKNYYYTDFRGRRYEFGVLDDSGGPG